MSSTSLAVSRAHPDAVRIAAFSAALALNLAVLLAALRPMAWPALDASRPDPALPVRFIAPVAPPPPAPPVPVVKPLPHAAPRPVQVRTPPPVAPPSVPTEEGRLATPPAAVPTPTPPAVAPTAVAPPEPPAQASLAYRSAPLSFPSIAVRQHMHGTVLLRVLVDEEGKPVEVVIEQSSGYAVLDRSAREQVLASWRFEPATVQGRPARAWARVPVSFALREQ
ncbi:energy transducer TonB [Frateuria defendens]|uniref:energy transducer TonB n=1 Tax=Frateuria defendens TaxID=2219559 RepID=UPI00066FCCE0|nr:energy transducer TonB [Frateuria defendens]